MFSTAFRVLDSTNSQRLIWPLNFMLDFASLSAQMEQMLDDEKSRPAPLDAVFQAARNLCQRSATEDFNGTIAQALSDDRVPPTWHPATLYKDGAPDTIYNATNAPESHRIVASDGSQIYADAHQISDCYLLHISGIDLRYGALGSAQMAATAHFFYNGMQDEWHAALAQGSGLVGRELVDARRHVAELDELARLLEEQTVLPTLGMGDGIFDLRVSSQQAWRDWAQNENDRVLDRLRSCGQPICGYIAASRATDVVTALRVVSGEWKVEEEAAKEMSRLSDARLFSELLPDGARSSVFLSRRNLPSSTRSAPNANNSRHQTAFFYLKIEDGDVARLEFPIWVAQRDDWLDQIHALTLSQIEKGDGYPLALMEAHEHAVVRGEEREMFYQLLEELMTRRNRSPRRSSKSRSKARPLV
jgi:hypothetical protein